MIKFNSMGFSSIYIFLRFWGSIFVPVFFTNEAIKDMATAIKAMHKPRPMNIKPNTILIIFISVMRVLVFRFLPHYPD